MVNTRQFSGSTYMQDMTKSHTFSAKNQGSTYTPIQLVRRELRYCPKSKVKRCFMVIDFFMVIMDKMTA